MINYNIPRLNTSMSKFLKGLHSRDKYCEDSFEKYFICGQCEGRGSFTDKSGECDQCNHCYGSGKILLKFTVERVKI